MDNPITTIVSLISEHPQAAATVASAYGLVKPFLTKVLGPATEELGEAGRSFVHQKLRAEKTVKVLAEASAMAEGANVEPQPVSQKILVPLLESASLEDDDFLLTAWAALLANAANPNGVAKVQPSFVEIMKQLTPLEVRILSAFLDRVNITSHIEPEQVTMETRSTRTGLTEVSDAQFYIALDNLSRLRLCVTYGDHNTNFDKPVATDDERLIKMALLLSPGHAMIKLTHLGIAFIEACTPPNASTE